MAAIPHRFQPFLQQAQGEGVVRFGQERDILASALAQAAASYHQGLQQARSAAAIIQAATAQQQKALADPSNPITSLALKYQNAPGSEGAVVAQNLGLTADSARAAFANHAVQAADAASYQGQALRRQYLSDAGKVQSQQAGLADRYGAYVTGRYDSLVGADRKQRHDANQQQKTLEAGFIKAGVTPSGKPIPGGPKDPNVIIRERKASRAPRAPGTPGAAKPRFTQTQVTSSLRSFRAGLQTASTYKLPKDIQVVQVALTQGLKPAGQPRVFGPVIKDPVLARAAAERYVYGYVSPATNRKLVSQYGFAAKTSQAVSPSTRRNAERLRKRPT